MSSILETKERTLLALLRQYGSVVIGYSGGVDSAYLASAALAALAEENVLAVTGRSPSYSADQRRMALQIAESIGLPHLEIQTSELEDPNYVANPSNRCYFCKTELYTHLLRVARERGFNRVLDGSNADDLDDYRPGLAAAREFGVRSPLQEAGLSKDEVRELSRRAKLPTWRAPASPCLASRIPYGLQVTRRRLRQIEEAESRLRALCVWKDVRVRHHGDAARLELDTADLSRMADPELRRGVIQALRDSGFAHACLDLQGYRRGALNEALGPRVAKR